MVWSLDLDDFSGEFCGQGRYPLINTIKTALGTGPGNECVHTHAHTHTRTHTRTRTRTRTHAHTHNLFEPAMVKREKQDLTRNLLTFPSNDQLPKKLKPVSLPSSEVVDSPH